MKLWWGAALAALVAGTAHGQQARDPGPRAPVSYDVRFDGAAHHEARISVTYRGLTPGPVEFRMARSSPGRYALHEFAKNVYSVTATDGAGKPLRVDRTDPYSWRVAATGDTVTVSYTLYGDRGDGTYAQIDPTHAHLNMPATFLWARGYDDRPIRVTFHPLKGWKVATQLPAAAGSTTTFWAPHLQYFMDSPTELADFRLREWQQAGAGGKSYTMRLAVHSEDTDADVDTFTAKLRRTIDQHFKLFGGPPAFDFGTYTFIADYMPQIDGDGMEHRNSTFISQPRSLKDANFRQLDTASHEFVHAWNVERLRPAELEPFDFTRANATPSLWVAEGFTQYYGPLMIRRAGESSLDDYLRVLGGTLGGVLNSPARRYGGPQEQSLRAPFSDAATAIDPSNGNISLSYYPYGAVIGLALDLTLRERYGSSLDALMRALWTSNGQFQANYAPARPYTQATIETALAQLTRDPAFARSFFDTSVRGSALPDFAPLLAPAGLVLRPARPDHGWLGATRVSVEGGAVALDQIPVTGSPLYTAGLDRGDVLVSVNGAPVADASTWSTATAALKPGQKVALVWRNRGGEQRATVTAAADPMLEVVRVEATGGTLNPQQAAFRKSWLGQ
ncbi:M61 family metallopeptidase [Sphingomonas aracearum]|uniref:M61 family peptidase n=1 Tax=Sphingomonas aracearum TaxID=2283317 RepID=A0A369VY98_9SPHN|nr:PDZ domain-containing protein [Sphingomonas aracearum]RDE06100.1 M61 family peptidase [Sphingomonas aracearum]